MKKKLLKFAIIGCGRIAQRHAQHILSVGVLWAVCDVVPEKSKELGKKYNAHYYTEIDELLEKETDINVVAVCTPNGLHSEHCIKALNAGFHVVCEKPMALNTANCWEMIKTAKRANKKLFVVKQNRFNPPVVAVKKMLDERRLGDIYSIQLSCLWNRNNNYYQNSWRGTNSLDGGTLFTQFSHFIDLLYWMFGDIQSVEAFRKNFHHQGIIEFEDTGVVILKFENGILGTLHYTVNCHGKNMEGSLTIIGEKGTIKIGGQYLNELEYQNIENYEIKDLPASKLANDYGHYQGSMSNHDQFYKNVVCHLTNGAEIVADGYTGLKTVEIIRKIYANSHLQNISE